MAVDEERELSQAYRTTKRVRRPEGQGLNDLYVRFFRMAERRIAEKTGQGIVCFISNYSWLDGRSFTGMRERYLEAFDAIRIDNACNGDKHHLWKDDARWFAGPQRNGLLHSGGSIARNQGRHGDHDCYQSPQGGDHASAETIASDTAISTKQGPDERRQAACWNSLDAPSNQLAAIRCNSTPDLRLLACRSSANGRQPRLV